MGGSILPVFYIYRNFNFLAYLIHVNPWLCNNNGLMAIPLVFAKPLHLTRLLLWDFRGRVFIMRAFGGPAVVHIT